jgi:S-adenosylmethionine uptake transporter
MQALWMLAASLFFATMAVCVKFASQHFGPGELLFYRGVIGMALMWAWSRSRGEGLGTHYPWMHAWRSLVGVLSLGAWFFALAGLPLATAMTLNYMSSVWIAAFLVGGALIAWNPRAGDPPPARQGALALTVLAGFGGVVLLLRPTMGEHQLFAALVGLLSGLLAAFAYLQVMALGKIGEPEGRTVFYFAVATAVLGGLWMLVGGATPVRLADVPWLLAVGLFASLGQLCMTRAYSQGATLVVANLQYTGIVFAAVYGLLLFGDDIPAAGWAGMALIMASGVAATVLRARAAPGSPGEDHS